MENDHDKQDKQPEQAKNVESLNLDGIMKMASGILNNSDVASTLGKLNGNNSSSLSKKVEPHQVGEIEEILRLIIQLIDETIQQLLTILEQIVAALIERLPAQG